MWMGGWMVVCWRVLHRFLIVVSGGLVGGAVGVRRSRRPDRPVECPWCQCRCFVVLLWCCAVFDRFRVGVGSIGRSLSPVEAWRSMDERCPAAVLLTLRLIDGEIEFLLICCRMMFLFC